MGKRRGRSATARHRSGPMPAGSPAVNASGGSDSEAQLDVRFVPNLLAPELGCLCDATRAQRLIGVLASRLAGVVVVAPAEQLQDVPAELGVERFADLTFLERGGDVA